MSPSPAAAVADPPSSPPVARPNYKLLPIESLTGSLLNPRKHFDAGKLQELADSFRGSPDGIIEPLVVRRSKDFCGSPYKGGDPTIYEIVAGERRYRAAKLAKLTHVPAIVRELTDDQVLEIMVIENNQREDVNALEEAEGFHQLLKRGWEPEKLAERLGRSKKYVYDRIKLLDLVPTAKQLVLDGLISPGHAILLARLKAKNQKLRESGQAKKAEARERKQEETWQAQQRKAEEERRAWEAVLAKALPAFAEHLKGQKVTPDVIRRFVWSGDLGRVEKLTGPLTDRNMGQVLALLGVLHDIHGRDAFIKAVKPYGFNLAPFEKPAQTSAQPKSKKPAAKKAAKAKKPAARKAAKKR